VLTQRESSGVLPLKQLVKHAGGMLGSQTKPFMQVDGAPPWLQLPLPSHVFAAVCVLPAHVAPRHIVPAGYFSQAPDLQRPSVPQLACPWFVQTPCGSGWPSATAPQAPFAPLPFFAVEHAWQAPLHALLQQNPSTQNPLAHWSFAVQANPCMICARHAPPLQ
jgi:hypothetical protein